MTGRILVLLLALLGAGCTLHHHRLPADEYPPQRLRRIEAEAQRRCEDLRGPEATPAADFRSDGCTLWPDRAWRQCCVEHDMSYWCGGTPAQRRAADALLRRCVEATGAGANARLMYWGTRLGGARWLPFWWRWGYGRPWPAATR